MVTSANAINATLYDSLNFNFIRDIAPIAMIDSLPNVMEVNPSISPRPFRSSSITLKPIRASSIWLQLATEARRMYPASCSK